MADVQPSSKTPVWQDASAPAGALSSPGYGLAYAFALLCFGMWVVTVLQLPLGAFLRDINIDDSFYYDVIARNLAHGLWSTFDGTNPTNGYHPLWAFLLTPVFGLVADPVAALRVAKIVELILLFGASACVMSVGRAAGWTWLAACIVPLWLFGHLVLFNGMESAPQALLLAVALYLTLRLFSDFGRSSAWLALAVLCALLPWVRLELIAAALTLDAGVTAYAIWNRQWRTRDGLLLWAVTIAGFAVYLIYNELAFGTPVPVSGQVKGFWSSLRIAQDSGFSLLGNAVELVRLNWKPTVAALASVALVAGSWAMPAYRSRRFAANHAIDAFLVALAAAHLSRLAYSMLATHADYDSAWYYVPGEILLAMLVPVALSRVFLLSRPPVPGGGRRWVEMGAGALCLVAVAWIFQNPWSLRSNFVEPKPRDWNVASYEGVRWMNANLPAEARIGSPDAGVVGYFSRHKVFNLDGLVNSTAFFAAVRNQTVEQWMRAAGIDYLAGGMRADVTDGCAYMASASVQQAPYQGPCRQIYEGAVFEQSFGGETSPMRFRVFAFGAGR